MPTMRIKRIVVVLLAVLLGLVFSVAAFAADDMDKVALIIKGDGVEKEVTFTYQELVAMKNDIARYFYSSYNNWPTEKSYYAEVIPLNILLAKAGLKPAATTINIAAANEQDGSRGYNATILLDDLFQTRYAFSGNKKETVPAAIALNLGDKDYANMNAVDLRFVYGQLDKQEQTNPNFVESVRTITVTCEEIKQLEKPKAEAVQRTDGKYDVKLSSSFYNAKIYYTTNGAAPTVGSIMFNVSAEHWQPHLNIPFVVSGDTEIKAIAVASGYTHSEVFSFTVAQLVNGTEKTSFTDVSADYWAYSHIDELVRKGILAGMGDGTFQPEGQLTRAQFAKMIVLAINGEEPPAAKSATFDDVKLGIWYIDYVEEAVRLGLFKGYEDGSFRPNNPVSRQEMLTIAVRALPDGEKKAEERKQGNNKLFIADEGISNWAQGYVEYAYDKGLIPDRIITMKSGKFNMTATDNASRAEAAYVINSYLKINPN